MFIDFPAVVSEWVELRSLASSLRNDALSRKTQAIKPCGTEEVFEVFKVSA